MKRFYEVKDVFASDFGDEHMVKDVDLKSRTITGYFSRFGNVDHDNDILVPGAFTRTIKERGMDGKNIVPHILDHDIHVTLKMLSKPKIYEKADGGFFESKVSDTSNGMDTLKLYRDGVINQHSFGFKTIKNQQKGNYNEIQEVMLYEISTVTLGANEETPFTGFKGLTPNKLRERYEVISKAFYNGDYTDDTFVILQAQLKELEQQIIKSFFEQKETSTTTQPVTEVITEPEAGTKELFDSIQLLTIKHFV